MSQDASEVYARLLLPKRHGYPLWIPEPNRRLPDQYRTKGVSIGDVGIVTMDGAFDFLFNICLPSTDPANADGVPDGFEPLVLGPRDIFEVEHMHDPASDISTTSIRKTQLGMEGSTSDNPFLPLKFTTSTSEGAILMLPEGGSRWELRNLAKFQHTALQNAVRWYQYVNGPLGRQATNGSIYLITGCDKSNSWGVASFSTRSEEHGVSLIFTAAGTAANYAYSWETVSPVAVRTGPKRGDGIHGVVKNQCVFLRGFKLALRESYWAKLFGPVHLSSIMDSGDRDILGKRRGIPYSGSSASSSSMRRLGGSSSGQEQRRPELKYESVDETSDGGVMVEHAPEWSEPFHPSKAISDFLFEYTPNASIAIIHDQDWLSVLGETEETLPKASELLRRIRANNTIVEESGNTYLTQRDSQVESSIPGITSGSTTSRHVGQVQPVFAHKDELDEATEFEEGTAGATPTKRGRGRAKGSKNKKSNSSAPAAGSSTATPRKRGRPPKEKKGESGAEEPPQKRKRGRPPKVSQPDTAGGGTTSGDAAESSTRVRVRGRPPKNAST